MEFSINPQFSYELTNRRHSEPLSRLEYLLNDYFRDKSYGESLTKIYWGAICVSKGFEQFFTARPPRFSRKDPDVQIECKLDFNTYNSMENQDRLIYIWENFSKSINDIFEKRSIKGFNSISFVNDLKSFWLEKSDEFLTE